MPYTSSATGGTGILQHQAYVRNDVEIKSRWGLLTHLLISVIVVRDRK